MKVFVNDTCLELFEGATVKDALNKYFTTVLKNEIKTSGRIADLIVSDNHGNRVMTDGSLSANDCIYIENNPGEKPLKDR